MSENHNPRPHQSETGSLAQVFVLKEDWQGQGLVTQGWHQETNWPGTDSLSKGRVMETAKRKH